MQVIRGDYNIKQKHRGGVVTIGNFDGLHLGHRKLLEKLQEKAREINRPTMAIIFEPQPNEFFSPHNNTSRLMRLREKIAAFRQQGIDYVLCLRFNHQIAMQKPENFVTELLVNKLAASYVLVGDDFRFGYLRSGDCALLQKMGKMFQFQADCMPTLDILGERVSSTRIRKLLETGDLELIPKLLGRPFEMHGKVVHGAKRGRIFGFPTANLDVHRRRVPLAGVFVVKMMGILDRPISGVANIGTRPTVCGKTRMLLEVHLLDFNQNIYGKNVIIQFLFKLRDEVKFDSVDDLIDQIKIDILQAKEYFLKN